MIESNNSSSSAFKVSTLKISGNDFEQLNRQIMMNDDLVLDLGASQIEKFFEEFQQNSSILEEIDFIVVPVIPNIKEIEDTLVLLEILKNANLGINTYGVAVMDAYGCIASDSVSITYVLSVDEIGSDLGIKIYPNPTKGQFNLEIEGTINQNYSLDILDITGQTLFHEDIEINNTVYTKKFDLRNYPKGVYLLRLMNNGLMQTYKLIIQ